ncbi:MAG: thiamine pyrophosphate-binding protein [Chloroflexi bacterium]|nr:thiamine pyrophosphate-binding protein [Chloroflexota bacterium]
MPRMTGGQAAVHALRREGVEVVFALPGVQIMQLFDAFHGQRDIRLVTVRHEQATTHMADGYARVSGKPGVALVVPGPGVLNAATGLGTAYASSSPVLLLAGQVESHAIGSDTGALHEVNDQLDVVRPLTKWCRRVLRVADIPAAIHEAFRQMNTGRPRPTEVEIPPDVLAATGDVDFPEPAPETPRAPDPGAVERAAALLRQARRPLIWAGGGAVISGCSEELAALADVLGAPVATTPEGKGAIPEDHPHSLGTNYYGHGAAALAMPSADVVLAVGTRLTGIMRGTTALRPPHQLIHIDVDGTVPGKVYPAEVAVHSDARLALQALLDALGPKMGKPRWHLEEVEKMRQEARRWVQEQAPLQLEVINTIQRELPQDAVLVSGVTNVGYWCNLAYPVTRPRTYFTSSYFATLGYAFPLSLGAKIATGPDRPVVCLSGDGGFLYGASELATAVQFGINVVAIVFADGAFGASLNDQRTRYGGREVGTRLHNPDLVRLAEAFGARGIRCSGPDGVGKALRQALDGGRPTLIEVPMPTLAPPFQIPPRSLS